ncbi:MAG: 50S ribosomal protein L16 [Elusimicrobia bacterium]|nr:50S ribosomal protein L16 [Elusimicrobiota bacterium]
MLMPKRVKYRKTQHGRRRGKATRGNKVSFGEFGLMATECGEVSDRQIEAARVALMRFIKKGGKVWVRIFPDKPITRKPAETRMGKGKGDPDHWAVVIKPGRVMYELQGLTAEQAKEAMKLAGGKLSVKTRFVSRFD